MRGRWLLLPVSLGLLLFLCTCSGQSASEPTPVPSPVPTTVYPWCDPMLLERPQMIFPVDGEVSSDLQPLFEWASPGYTIDDPSEPDEKTLCKTKGFNIYLSSGPYFQDEIIGFAGGVPGIDSLYTVTWTPSVPLEPATQYLWQVLPVTEGGDAQVSEIEYFFTGPVCDPYTVVIPKPLSPPNHWTTDDLGDFALTWDVPGECLPDGYVVELADGPDFDSALSTVFDPPEQRWEVGALLEDCTRYYWRVRAITGGSEGQNSQIYTFTVNLTGSCPTETSAIIHGTLWEDQCDWTDGPDPMPLGCTLNDVDMLFPNQTYDPGEPGIEGAVVTIATGACPTGTILRGVPTWGDGTYDIYWVPPGTYCLGIDLYYAWNVFLMPGTWTFPLDAVLDTTAEQTVTLNYGEVKTVDFGWWFTYGNGWGETTGSVVGMVWHDLCEYNPGDPEPDPMPVGCSYDEWGIIHADGERLAHEPGIPGVVVDIGLGDCPSSGYATAVTDYNGAYHFNNLPAGKYCLRIDPAHGSSNEVILMPGSWTKEPSGHEGMTFKAITVEPAKTLPGQDFGWDYDNLPEAATPTPSTPTLTLVQNANCRLGPSFAYDVVDNGFVGEAFRILGRDVDNNWLLVRFTDRIDCWMGRATGISNVETWNLPIREGPPLPTITPVCSIYLDEKSCELNLACKWVPGTVTRGTCVPK